MVQKPGFISSGFLPREQLLKPWSDSVYLTCDEDSELPQHLRVRLDIGLELPGVDPLDVIRQHLTGEFVGTL